MREWLLGCVAGGRARDVGWKGMFMRGAGRCWGGTGVAALRRCDLVPLPHSMRPCACSNVIAACGGGEEVGGRSDVEGSGIMRCV